MDFETKDRLNDVERRTARLEDDISTMPSTIPTTLSGDSSTTIIQGQATDVVEDTDATFDIDNIVVISGTDPRSTPVSASQTVTVKNTFALNIDDNSKVFAIESDAGEDEWETWRPGEGGIGLRDFELIEDMAVADVAKLAKPLLSTGAINLSGAPFYVIDLQLQFFGYVAYNGADDSSQAGFQGDCKFFTDDWNSTGVPGYLINTIDGLAPSIIVELDEDPPSGSTKCRLVSWSGTNHSDRIPKRSEAGKMLCSNAPGYATAGLVGQTWEAEYSVEQGQFQLTQELLQRAGLRGEINVAAGHVLLGDSTFLLDTLEVVRGRMPTKNDGSPYSATDKITVKNSPGIIGENGDLVEVEHDATISTDEASQWRTLPLNFAIVKGTLSGAITSGTTHFTLSGVTAVEGDSPGTTIDVTNFPPLDAPMGATIYAHYCPADSYDDNGKRHEAWDTSVDKNEPYQLRGQPQFDPDEDQYLFTDDSDGNPRWKKVPKLCEEDVVIDVYMSGNILRKDFVASDAVGCAVSSADIIDLSGIGGGGSTAVTAGCGILVTGTAAAGYTIAFDATNVVGDGLLVDGTCGLKADIDWIYDNITAENVSVLVGPITVDVTNVASGIKITVTAKQKSVRVLTSSSLADVTADATISTEEICED